MGSTLNVVQMTDLHLYADTGGTLQGMNTEKSFCTVLEKIQQGNTNPIDFIVLTGDLVQDESEQGYQRLKQHLCQTGIPFYLVSGNHDAPDLLTKYFSDGAYGAKRSVRRNGWQFIFVDTHEKGSIGGRVSIDVFDELAHLLKQHETEPTALFMHHPPVPVGSAWLDRIALNNAEKFHSFVSEHANLQLVVCGHVHQESEFKKEGVTYLTTPSTCFQFEPQKEEFSLDHRLPGWRVFKFCDDGVFSSRVERLEKSLQTK